MSETTQPTHFFQYENGSWKAHDSYTISETSVALTVNSQVWLSFMCTPADLEALAIGFLFNEGMITSMQEIADVRVCQHMDNVDVWTNIPLERPASWRRTSGCTGGQTSVEAEPELTVLPQIYNGALLSPETVLNLVNSLFETQDLYRLSGGVHTSALTDCQGTFISAEDIGRHNTLDKIAGKCLMQNIQLQRRVIITTGRISSEMLQKAARLGAAVLISRTSPTSLSINMAHRYGITLIGYARRDRFKVYTHHERILDTPIKTKSQSIKTKNKQNAAP